MLIVVEWSQEAFDDPSSLDKLAATAARHEVVLVCPLRAVGSGIVATLRRALPRRELVAILVDGEVAPHERRLVEELLNDGGVPVVLTPHDPVPPAVTEWLEVDARLPLPAAASWPEPDRRTRVPQPAEPTDPATPATSPATRSGCSNGSR